jgi:hypothetical protein
MTPFWGKRENDVSGGAGDAAGAAPGQPRAERRFTISLARAEQLAMMLAHSRAAKFVEVADMLAGMYIYEWDRLSKFWTDRDSVEGLLRRICSISPQRWHHWIELYDKQRHREEKETVLQRFRLGSRNSNEDAQFGQVNLQRSIELENLLEAAGEISPFSDDLDGRAIPVLTSECVLLCIARNEASDVSRRLRDTGLDIQALERAARDPRRAPHR